MIDTIIARKTVLYSDGTHVACAFHSQTMTSEPAEK